MKTTTPLRRVSLAGSIAALLLAAAPALHAQSFQWNTTAGNWGTPGNWTPAGPPNSATAIANFTVPSGFIYGVSLTGGPFTVNALSLQGHVSGSYELVTGTLVFDGTAPLIQIQNANTFTNVFDNATLQLNKPTTVFTEFADSSFTITGKVTDGGTGAITKTGLGTLVLDGTGGFGTATYGGATQVNGGTFKIVSGGKLSDASDLIGGATGSNGTVLVDGPGSTWTNNGSLTVGNAGTGLLTIQNGGKVSNTLGTIGNNPSSKGTVLVTGPGSTWANSGGLVVGVSGTGLLTIQNGGTVSNVNGHIGFFVTGNGTVLVTGPGSTWTNSSDVTVGDAGTGLLTIQNGGVVNVGGGATVTLASNGGSFGTLNIGAFGGGTTAGTLNAAVVNGGGGTAVINFNQTDTTTFTPQITGSIALNQLGTGTTILTGANTYTGITNVNGGGLLVNGSLASPQVFVHAGGLLGGNGFLAGSVSNGGWVSPGNSPGTLHVGGNYTQSAAGGLRIEVGGRNPGEFDVLAVGGHASLDGTLQLVRLNNFKLKRGDKFEFLTAIGGVSGTFATVNSFGTGTILDTEVVYEPNAVVLEVAQGSFGDFASAAGLTPNQRAVGRALDRVAFDTRETKLIGFLNGEPLGKVPEDLDRIAPEELASIFDLGKSLANVQTANLQRRMDDLRAGASGFSASGFAMSGSAGSYSGGLAGATGPEGKSGKMMTPTADNRWGVFVTGTGEFTKVGDTANASGYDLNTGGFTLGVDFRLTPNFALGVNAGYARTGIDLNHGGRITVDGGKLGLYATYFTGGFYADAAVGGGLNSYSTRRSALQGDARGSEDGGELNTLFATGYDWKAGALTLGPTASFQYDRTSLGSFTENGSLAPLHFGSQHADSLRSAFGAKASYDWKVRGVLIRPEVRAAWQHEYGTTAYALDSSFANGGGGAFTTNGPATGRNSLLIGAGFAVQWNERVSTYVYYDGEIGRSNFDSHNISGGVRCAF